MMLTLGIETSERTGAVALCRDGVVLAERSLEQAGRRHAQTLAAEADRLFRDFSLRPRDCDAVAVSIGPGSFTGLRVGVVFAKTFAYAAGCRLAAIDTFLCVAANSPADIDELSVIGDAQRGELYVGRYRRDPQGIWRSEETIKTVDGASWTATRVSTDVVSGPGVERFEAGLSNVCRVLQMHLRLPRAAVVASLGERRMLSGVSDDPWRLQPFYLRKSAAEEKRALEKITREKMGELSGGE